MNEETSLPILSVDEGGKGGCLFAGTNLRSLIFSIASLHNMRWAFVARQHSDRCTICTGAKRQAHCQSWRRKHLVDEFWLKIFPVTLSVGKRVFDKGTIPAVYTLMDSKTWPSGVIIATRTRGGM